jgi:hypothetical protein
VTKITNQAHKIKTQLWTRPTVVLKTYSNALRNIRIRFSLVYTHAFIHERLMGAKRELGYLCA